MTAISRCEGTRDGSGSCTCLGEYSGAPGAKPTSGSDWPATARTVSPMARFKGSVGASLRFGPLDMLPLAQGDVGRALGQLLAERALVELRHHRAFELIALVEEGE